jgi:AcrR family transcriptional regulator
METGSIMELREKILDAVVEEFNEKGPKFSMDDLAKRLGISKRTLYSIIDSKESLFLEMVDHVFGAIKESERKIAGDPNLDVMEKLKKILIILPEKYKTVDFRRLYELKTKLPKIYAKIEKRLETDWDLTFRIMQQAIDEGKIRKINMQVFQAIFSGTIEYYLSRSVLIDNKISYEDGLEQMLDILINGICVKQLNDALAR